VELLTGTGLTAVQKVQSSSGTTTWNGGFVLGDVADLGTFVSDGAKMTNDGTSISTMSIEKMVKIGADTLGVGMELNRPITVSVPVTANKQYRVITSEDGLNWSLVGSGSKLSSGAEGKLAFRTQRFSYFGLVVAPPAILPSCSISASASQVTNGSSVTLTWSSQNALQASLDGVGNQSIQGTQYIVPPNSTNTLYTLTVVGEDSISSTCQVSVTTIASSGGGGGGGG
jgi:hypothetical protein